MVQMLEQCSSFLTSCCCNLLNSGAASRGNSSEAGSVHAPEAAGGGAEQPAGDAGGRGGEQEERGEASFHPAGSGLYEAFRAGDHQELNLVNKNSIVQLTLSLPVHFHSFPSAAGRYEEEGGTGGLVSGGSRGEPQEGAAGAGQPDAAAGGEDCNLRQAGQDKNPSAAGAG